MADVVTVCTRLVTVVPAESVTVSVRVPALEFTTVASTDVVENALLPSTRLVTVRVRPPLVTVVLVTRLASGELVVLSGLRSDTT